MKISGSSSYGNENIGFRNNVVLVAFVPKRKRNEKLSKVAKNEGFTVELMHTIDLRGFK